MSSLNVFTGLKNKFPSLMFFVSRETDLRVVAYSAVRLGKRLSDRVCDHINVDLANMDADAVPVSSVLVDNFYGFSTPVYVTDGEYRTTMHAIPDRPLKVLTKKTKTVLIGRVGKCESAVIIRVHLHVDMSKIIPSITKFIVTGLDPVTRSIVEESVTVTSDMITRFDVSKIVSSYMRS